MTTFVLWDDTGTITLRCDCTHSCQQELCPLRSVCKSMEWNGLLAWLPIRIVAFDTQLVLWLVSAVISATASGLSSATELGWICALLASVGSRLMFSISCLSPQGPFSKEA